MDYQSLKPEDCTDLFFDDVLRSWSTWHELRKCNPILGEIFISIWVALYYQKHPANFAHPMLQNHTESLVHAALSARELIDEFRRLFAKDAERQSKKKIQEMVNQFRSAHSQDIKDAIACQFKEFKDYFNQIVHHNHMPETKVFIQNVGNFEELFLYFVRPSLSRPNRKQLDTWIQKADMTNDTKMIKQVVTSIRSSRASYDYFFYTASSPVWLDYLLKVGIFKEANELISYRNGKVISGWNSKI